MATTPAQGAVHGQRQPTDRPAAAGRQPKRGERRRRRQRLSATGRTYMERNKASCFMGGCHGSGPAGHIDDHFAAERKRKRSGDAAQSKERALPAHGRARVPRRP